VFADAGVIWMVVEAQRFLENTLVATKDTRGPAHVLNWIQGLATLNRACAEMLRLVGDQTNGYCFPVLISTRFDSKGRYDSAAVGATGVCLSADRDE
jgi:hypothetical protein